MTRPNFPPWKHVIVTCYLKDPKSHRDEISPQQTLQETHENIRIKWLENILPRNYKPYVRNVDDLGS